MTALTKEMEGRIIYARPLGNNARRWDGKPIIFEVIKVKRVYAELRKVGYSYSHDYYIKNGSIKGDGNSGYKFFETEACMDEYAETLRKRSKVEEIFRSYKKVSDECVLKVYAVLLEDGAMEREQ